MTVPMALMDFLPVLFFGAAWVILYRDLKNKLDLCSGILLPLGALIVLLAGFFKAFWKLQNALGVAPMELFNKAFFPAQSIGFVLLGVGMLAFMYGKRRIVRSLTMVFVIPIYAWIFYFVTFTMHGDTTPLIISMPWGTANLMDNVMGFMPLWIVIYTLISLPIGQLENKLINHILFKKRLKALNAGEA